MCGIAGILTTPDRDPASLDELRSMAAMLRHRGPDAYGLYRDATVGLAHTRLSIIDPAGGDQPIHNEDHSIWVVFNGEIFNYLELRKELEDRGHRFYTRSDTEVIVHSYEQYGQEAWQKFNGQFAMALWDRRSRRVWLVRDHFGILPLYYAHTPGRLIFASEAKAIFASGHIEPRFNGTGLQRVFSRWAVPAPATVFDGLQSVPPGTALCVDESLRTRCETYWRPSLASDPRLERISLEDAAELLAEHLDSAVRLRLRADVPVGAYLSGGLDSSMIARYIRQADSSPLQTFAVRFSDPAFDETPAQRRMADLLGTHHHEILCGAEQIREALPEVVWHCETPLLRTAPAPLFLLSELVRDNGMKVVLTGEGADELLAGYHIFKEDKVRRFWARQPASLVRPALLSKLYPYIGDGRRPSRFWQQFFRRGLTDLDHPFYSHRVRWDNTGWCLRFLAPHLLSGSGRSPSDTDLEAALPDGWHRWPPLARAQAIEIVTFMSPYLLSSQGDRVAMSHGVEVRYPFLDPEFVDVCCRMPPRFKLRGLRDKLVLRRLASRHLPREIWDRSKQPYRAPTTRALFDGRSCEYVDELLSLSCLKKFGLVEIHAAGRLVHKARARQGRMSGEREEMALVGILTLQLLAQQYLEGFAERTRRQRTALDGVRPSILVDNLSGAFV